METSTPPAAPRSRASQIANDRLTRWIGCVIAFALAFFVLFLTMPRYLNVYDESFMLTGALRVNAGELPYRDFYAIYGPAEYYALAGLFKLFGPSVLAERLFDFTVEALIVATTVPGDTDVLSVQCTRILAGSLRADSRRRSGRRSPPRGRLRVVMSSHRFFYGYRSRCP